MTLTNVSGGNPATHVVEVKDFEFVPKDISITLGDTVLFDWTGAIAHTATSDATTGADVWDSGLIGQGSKYKVVIQNTGTHPYYCIPHGAPGGVGMAGTITANPPCNNGEVAVNVQFIESGGSVNGFLLLKDGVQDPMSPFAYDASGTNSLVTNLPGDGMNHTVQIIDADDANCSSTQNIATPDCNPPMLCVLGLTATQTSGCDALNQIGVELNITNQSSGSIFNVFVNGNLYTGSPFAYFNSGNTTLQISVPGDGQPAIIEVRDIDSTSCFAVDTIITPQCQLLCEIQNLTASADSSVIHLVEVRDFDFFPKEIDVKVGETIRFIWTGIIPHTVTSDAISGIDSWDSGLFGVDHVYDLQIKTSGTHPYYCIPHGGPNGIGMAGVINATENCQNGLVDVVVDFSVTTGSPNGFNLFTDGNLYPGSPFQYQNQAGQNQVVIQMPGDGQTHLITVQDMEVSFCAATTQVNLPDCTAQCGFENLGIQFPTAKKHIVEVADFEFIPKDINIFLGDTIQFLWTGIIPHTATSDAIAGANVFESGLLGKDSIFEIVLTEAGLHPYYCIPHGGPGGIGMAGTINIVPPCDSGKVVGQFSFDKIGNGTTYHLFVDGNSHTDNPLVYAASGKTAIDLEIVGDGQSHLISVTDSDDATCSDSLQFIAPECPQICDMNMTMLQTGNCRNLGHIPYTITLLTQNTDTAGFEIFLDGSLVRPNPYAYGQNDTTIINILLPGDSMLHEIVMRDLLKPSCSDTIIIFTPKCDLPCAIDATFTQTSACDSTGNLGYEIAINTTNSSAVNLFINSQPLSGNPFQLDTLGNVIVPISLTGDGSIYGITVTDFEKIECSDSLAIGTPDCSNGCEMSFSNIEIGTPATHEVEVRDFDFLPIDITINLGDTVRFVWTGDIPHTATSDTTAGPDVFNSGLLGNGAVYDLVLNTEGFHPYYCIPHGAPGGVGMAGSITVNDPCANDSLEVQFSFMGTNLGFSGYNVTIDGVSSAHNPRNYDSRTMSQFIETLPADGQTHKLEITDVDFPNCKIDTSFLMPSCEDDCLGFAADFSTTINQQTFEVQFEDQTNASPDGWLWTFGDGAASTLQNPTHTFTDRGDYQVCLIASDSNGCKDTICQIITIGEFVCEASFRYEVDGLTVNFFDESQTSEPIKNWTYSLGNNLQITGMADASYTYDSLGVYEVCLQIEADTCIADTCLIIDLTDPCLSFKAEFAHTISSVNDLGVQFLDLTSGSPNSWLWGFGDGTTSSDQNPYHEYTQPDVYKVCLLVQDTDNGCNANICEDIPVQTSSVSKTGNGVVDLVVFPNPNFGQQPEWAIMGILEHDFFKKVDVTLHDVQGQLHHYESTQGSPLLKVKKEGQLASGLYLMTIRSATKIYRAKLIVE